MSYRTSVAVYTATVCGGMCVCRLVFPVLHIIMSLSYLSTYIYYGDYHRAPQCTADKTEPNRVTVLTMCLAEVDCACHALHVGQRRAHAKLEWDA